MSRVVLSVLSFLTLLIGILFLTTKVSNSIDIYAPSGNQDVVNDIEESTSDVLMEIPIMKVKYDSLRVLRGEVNLINVENQVAEVITVSNEFMIGHILSKGTTIHYETDYVLDSNYVIVDIIAGVEENTLVLYNLDNFTITIEMNHSDFEYFNSDTKLFFIDKVSGEIVNLELIKIDYFSNPDNVELLTVVGENVYDSLFIDGLMIDVYMDLNRQNEGYAIEKKYGVYLQEHNIIKSSTGIYELSINIIFENDNYIFIEYPYVNSSDKILVFGDKID